jgi:hypothetical protein
MVRWRPTTSVPDGTHIDFMPCSLRSRPSPRDLAINQSLTDFALFGGLRSSWQLLATERSLGSYGNVSATGYPEAGSRSAIVSCRECVHLANAASKGSVAYPSSSSFFAEVIHLKPAVFRGLLFLPRCLQ